MTSKMSHCYFCDELIEEFALKECDECIQDACPKCIDTYDSLLDGEEHHICCNCKKDPNLWPPLEGTENFFIVFKQCIKCKHDTGVTYDPKGNYGEVVCSICQEKNEIY